MVISSGHSVKGTVRPQREDLHEWIGEYVKKKGHDPSRMWVLQIIGPYGDGPLGGRDSQMEFV